jgi:hypothetical protein
MTNEEKTSLKAACLQAATTLIAARDSIKGAVDVDECVKLAAELYCRVTAMNWQPGNHVRSTLRILLRSAQQKPSSGESANSRSP